MYGVNNYVTTKRGRYRVTYYRCRRAQSKGTCAARQIPAAVVERAVIDELRRMGLDRERVAALAGEAQATFEAVLQRLFERRDQTTRSLARIGSRLESLLELAEDRLVSKQEFAGRRAKLEAAQGALDSELATPESEIAARASMAIDPKATMRVRRRKAEVELHVSAVPLLVWAADGPKSGKMGPKSHGAPARGHYAPPRLGPLVSPRVEAGAHHRRPLRHGAQRRRPGRRSAAVSPPGAGRRRLI
jgi:hypothetical protein